MTQDILFTREKHIGVVTLNRPNALNALTLPMLIALRNQLSFWDDDSSIHAIVVKAVEGRAFCAGGDVRFIYQLGSGAYAQIMDFFATEYHLNHFIHTLKKPYIALMDGITMGGGVGISLHGSHPVATERFRFAMPETSIGFFPDIGASYLLSRCLGHFGVYLGLTGCQLDAADAKALNLVNYVIASEQLSAVMHDLIDADLSIDTHQRVSELLQKFAQTTQPKRVSEIKTNVDAHFGATDMEAIMSSLYENKNDWQQQTYHLLAQKAPLSLKVTLEQLQRATSLTLAECLQMDYGLTSHFMRDVDFYEGVRALLIDKDNTPHWKPDTLAHVTMEMMAKYFEPCVKLSI
jgi:enoyl-CoA hydratase